MKDTFYFSHDYNTRNDIKIKRLIAKHNYLGYGIFWAIIEDLYNNANALPLDYDCIAFDLRADVEIVKSIINDFDLFVFSDGFFGSNSIQKRLNERNLKSIKARESALNRWNKSDRNANALQTQYEGNAIKERKEKESKGKEIKENFLLKKETKEENLPKENPSENFPKTDSVEPGAEERKKVAPKKERSEEQLIMPDDFIEIWEEWKEYRKAKRFKSYAGLKWEQMAVDKLLELSNKNPTIAKLILKQTYENSYQGFFPLKQNTNGITNTSNTGFSTSKPSTNNSNSGKRSYRQILAERLKNELKANGEGSNITIDAEICE